MVQRALGLFGGFVCAGAASLAAFYRSALVPYPFSYWLAATIGFVVLFGAMGVRWPRYFRHFFMPIVLFLAHADGVTLADGHRRTAAHAMASVALLASLVCLVVGAIFQFQLVALVGMGLFLAYAAAAFSFTRAERTGG